MFIIKLTLYCIRLSTKPTNHGIGSWTRSLLCSWPRSSGACWMDQCWIEQEQMEQGISFIFFSFDFEEIFHPISNDFPVLSLSSRTTGAPSDVSNNNNKENTSSLPWAKKIACLWVVNSPILEPPSFQHRFQQQLFFSWFKQSLSLQSFQFLPPEEIAVFLHDRWSVSRSSFFDQHLENDVIVSRLPWSSAIQDLHWILNLATLRLKSSNALVMTP